MALSKNRKVRKRQIAAGNGDILDEKILSRGLQKRGDKETYLYGQ